MISPIDWLAGRKNIVNQESEGINLAIQTINEFKNRKFTFKALKNKYTEINGEELLRLINEEIEGMLIQYSYTTRVKKYIDKKGISQLTIRLNGRASTISRYNPLDIELNIATKTNKNKKEKI